MEKIDELDRKLLNLLQVDSAQSVAEVSEQVGLSHNACWRRIKRLEDTGVIAKRVMLLQREKIDLATTVFMFVRTSQHDAKWLEKFSKGVKAIPEVVDFHRLSGDVDYIVKLYVRDIADYDRVYKELIRIAPLSDVTSNFSMEEIKSTTQVPVTVSHIKA